MGGNGGITTYSGQLSGSGSLTVAGGGLTLAQATAYAGPTAVTGGTLAFSGNRNTSNNVQLSSGGNVAFVTTSGNNVYSGSISGTGNVIFNVNGNVSANGGGDGSNFQFSNSGAFTGNVVINTGLVQASTADSIWGSPANAILMNASSGNFSGIVDTVGTVTITCAIQITNAGGTGVFRVYGGGLWTDNGTISGPGNLFKTDGGNLALLGANTFSGTATVGSGTLILGNSLALQNATVASAGFTFSSSVASHAFTFGGLAGGSGFALTDDASNPVALTVGGNNANNTYTGALSGGGSLIKIGSGSLALGGNNTYSGTTTVLAGSLALLSGGAINSSPTIALANGTTFDVSAKTGYALASAQTLTGTGNFSVAGSMTVNSGATVLPGGSGAFGTLTVGGLALNAGSLLKYDFGAGQDLINVTGSNGLTIAGGGINLYQGDGSSQLATTGTYTLMDYSGSFSGSPGNLTVLNANGLYNYGFAASGGSLTVTVANANYWTGGANPNFVWSNAANWSVQTPANGTPVTFTGSVGLSNTNDISGLNLGGMTFSNSAGAFNISGNSIQLSGAIASSSTATQTIGLNMTLLGGNQAIKAQAGTIVLNGAIDDAGAGLGLNLTGTGTVVLGGANTFSGPTTVSAGTLLLTNSLALQNSTLNNSAVAFDQSVVPHSFTIGGLSGATGFALTDNGSNAVALSVGNNGGTTTFSGALSGSGSLIKSGSGVLTLNGGNSYTGATIVNGGTLVVGTTTTLQTSPVGVNANGTLAFATGVTTPTFGGLTGSGDVTLPSTVTTLTLTPPAGASLSLSGALTSMAAGTNLTFNGAGSQTIGGGVNLGTGAVTVTSGLLAIGGTSNYTGTTTGSGGTLNLNGVNSSTGNLYTRNNGVVNINGTEMLTGGAAQFWMATTAGVTDTVNVAGTLDLYSANGSLVGQEVSGTSAFNILSGGVVNVANGEFRLGNTSNATPFGILTMFPGSLLTFDSQGSSTSFILANGGVGGGNVKGTLNLDGGTISTGRNVNGGIGTATFNFNGGVLQTTQPSSAFLNLGSNASSRANVRNGGAIIDTNSYAVVLVTPLSHSNIAGDSAVDGGLNVLGTGSVTLSGSNTYTGPTTVPAGTLILASAATINSTPTIALGSGATLDVSSQGDFHLLGTQTLTGTGNFNVFGGLTANAGSLILPGGPGAFGTLSIDSLTMNPGSAVSFDIGNIQQDLVNVNNSFSLTINGGGVKLYQADGMTQLSTPGTYTLMQYSFAMNGSPSSLSVLNPVLGDSYAFDATGGAVTVTVAAPSVWNGGGSPAFVWSNTANWASGQSPSSGQPIAFGGSTGLSNTNDIAGLNLTGITFFPSAGAYNLTGNSIQLSGLITNASTATQTIGLGIVLSGGNLAVNATAGKIVLSGVIDDGGGGLGLVIGGPGAVALTAMNTYSGGTVVNTGTLQVGNSAALGSGTLTLNGGGISSNGAQAVAIPNSFTLAGSVSLGDAVNNGPLTFTSAGVNGAANVQLTVNSPATFAGAISDAGSSATSLTMLGPSILALTAGNTYTGTTSVSGGTLQLNASGTPAIAGNLAVSSGVAQLLQSNEIPAASSVSVSGGLLDIGGNSNTVAGVQITGGTITGAGGTLSSTSNYDAQNGTINAILGGSVGLNKTTSGTVTLGAPTRLPAAFR